MTKFETAVLQWISMNCNDSSLKAQLQSASVSSREHTGVGCYSDLVLTSGVAPTQADYGTRGPLDGPGFESPVLKFGGGTLLWFDSGFAKTLEIYTFADNFPENHDDLGDFTLQ